MAAAVCLQNLAWSQGVTDQGSKQVVEPVFRVSKLVPPVQSTDGPQASVAVAEPAPTTVTPSETVPTGPTAPAPHPLDPALDIAYRALENMRTNIRDYTATLVKRERVDNMLGDAYFMDIKVRNERVTNAGVVPFSIYMAFKKPRGVDGREVIYVKGRNDGKLIAHEGGIGSMVTVRLDPTSALAMRGNRYPIYEAGLENLIVKLIEKAERDKEAGDCEVEYRQGAKINGRTCTLIQVKHAVKRAPYDFHIAQVFVDDELQIPVRYCAFEWPKTPGGEPVLVEEYSYINVKLNVGLKDLDFDPKNPAYKYR
ncbi:MAG TPA: DUF1571 domain-containing protein [Pirellulaceae bacterium]|nr:DUF1571 domain-containing protein [Pirellulaceae bacterium]